MPRTCKACNHPNRKEIDRDLATGVPLRNISQRVGIHATSLMHHRDNHLEKLMQKAVQKREDEVTLTADLVLNELRLHGFYDPGKMFDKNGDMLDINEMDPETRAVIKGMDFVNLYDGEGEQKHCFGQLRKIRMSDKIQALKLLGQHFGLFPSNPPPVQQNNFMTDVYLRSEEELKYFIAHGDWPPAETKPKELGPASENDNVNTRR